MKNVGYWVCTGLIVFFMLPGGIFEVMRSPQIVHNTEALGYPLHFIVFLGVWKILGSIALLAPKFPLLKEWAYAGIFFDLTGAAVTNVANPGPAWHVAAPLAIIAVLYGSWALRPESRRLAGV
jgi:DoxX-like family